MIAQIPPWKRFFAVSASHRSFTRVNQPQMAFQGKLGLVHFSWTLGTLQVLCSVVERDVLFDAIFVVCPVVALRTLDFLFTVLLFVFLFEVFFPFVFALEELQTLEEVALDGFMFVHEFHVSK